MFSVGGPKPMSILTVLSEFSRFFKSLMELRGERAKEIGETLKGTE